MEEKINVVYFMTRNHLQFQFFWSFSAVLSTSFVIEKKNCTFFIMFEPVVAILDNLY